MLMPKIRSLVRFTGLDRKKSSSNVEERQSILLLEERSDEIVEDVGQGGSTRKKKRAVNGAGLPPKGYVTMYVGKEEATRFVVPARYLSMPAFQPVMEMVREEFGYEQGGGLCVPCGAEEFMDIVRVTEEMGSDDANRYKKTTSKREAAL